MADQNSNHLIGLTTEIVASYLGNNRIAPSELPALIQSVHATLKETATVAAPAPAAEPLVPAVSIKKSVTPDYIISLEDGSRYKSLKRHLSTRYGMTPDEYRAKWGLPKDYPMVAPNYAAARSALAVASGLGQGGRKPAKKAAVKKVQARK